MTNSPRELVVTMGDPQGIGPEVAIAAAKRLLEDVSDIRIVLVGSAPDIEAWPPASTPGPGLRSAVVDGPAPSDPPPSAAGGRLALLALARGLERVREQPTTRALVTAPLSKEAVTRSGTPFLGHTEWLAQALGAAHVVMTFVAGPLRVALATVHVPLRDVADRLTRDGLVRTLTTLERGLQHRYGISRPRIAVLGLNPHAGEGGLLGREEIEVIRPALEAFRATGGHVQGPFSADTFFVSPARGESDAVLAMYHDQGLVAVKTLSFGKSVNVSLGLPIVRTSVDHGCAYALAGTGRADASSMYAAMEHALDLLATGRGHGAR